MGILIAELPPAHQADKIFGPLDELFVMAA
jgi:hypothetical protein